MKQQQRRTWGRLAGSLVAFGVLAACSGGSDADTLVSATTTVSTTDSTTTVVEAIPSTTEAPPTTADVATTVASTTAPPPPTTAPPSTAPPLTAPPLTVGDLVLMPTGIGPLQFGLVDPAALVATMTPLLGAPNSNSTATYPTRDGDLYVDADGEGAFAFPEEQTVCFTNGLCTFFGGVTSSTLTFVGYSQDAAVGTLATASGITVGSVWADFVAAMTVEEGGCFTDGFGAADGVALAVRSSDVSFTSYDPATETYVNAVPPLDQVSVTSLSAGELPFYRYLDC